MKKRFVFASMAALALASAGMHKAAAQTACPNRVAFGSHIQMPIDRNAQSQLEVTYFTTTDRGAMIPESTASVSASYMRMNSTQFVARLANLTSSGLATIKKQESASSYLGQTAELNLERDSNMQNAMWQKAAFARGFTPLSALDRETEISVNRGSASSQYYRVGVLSWFVESTSTGVRKFVDYDANILLKPGETAVFKLMGDGEMKRTGSGRSYVAITMKSVNATNNTARTSFSNLVASR
jgi:hypothetical protein